MKATHRRACHWLSSLMLLTLILAACGGNTSSNGTGQTLHVLIGYNTTYPTQQKQWMQQIGSDFQKATGATIAWDTYSSSNEEQTKLQNAIVTGSGPDVFSLGTTFVPTAQATKGFATLSDQDWKQVGGKDRFFKQQLSMSGISPSQQIAIPWVMRPFAMVYNKELFQKAGISAPPTTWTEFVQDAQKMTNSSAGIYGAEMDPSDSFDPWKIWWMFTEQMGGHFLSQDLKTAQLNTPQAVDAVKFWFDWANNYKIVDPNSMAWKAGDATQAFANGKVGMLIMVTSTLTPTMQKSSVADKYAFAPMPTIPYGMQQRPANGVPASTIVSGDMLAVADYSNVKDLAYKFINLVTDEAHQLEWTKTFGDLPTNVAAANSLASKDPQTAAFIQAEQGASPTPFSGAWGPLEVSLAGVSSKLANEVATKHYDPSHIKPLLDQANQQIQGQLH
ncbi:extracellular solute-binding protein [Ktedonosporobacter rubrisoli]|uniref:Extracellular solute-binding protein n=1 Tax=Ktedonosporobacter rubrisoli TaxID=2509675 RepID=A0A4P6K4R7_KTERU|nr:extracellular solute-binding protein [Ktedonosporobacter rubrisoli]QBD82516.1 extracellular solute-binding protein [Ktedonosporobacter rubrisoli]